MVYHGNFAVEFDRKKNISSLIELSIKGLSAMFDRPSHLFCFKAKTYHEGAFLRHTLISLLGLYRYEKCYGRYILNITDEVEYHNSNIDSFTSGGDIGLLLWLTALCKPEKIETTLEACRWEKLKQIYPDIRQNRTMELSWLLTGYSYCALRGRKSSIKKASDDALKVYSYLKSNYGGRGIFRHQKPCSPKGWINSMMGSFADQVYPIYALTNYATVFDQKEAQYIALECADTICRLQGPQGQWWWHYNPKKGTVAGRYPVYSVHQEGMAPFPLFTLSKVTGRDYSDYIYKGLDWIRGENELRYPMIDYEKNVVWRNIHNKKIYRRIEEFFNILGVPSFMIGKPDFMVLHECWSYELGWLLYAFADETIIEMEKH
ncbi:MAG TPA: hypothetical protein VHO70_01680 [Chitinispirillaceae bacterium]|nr:hypothetical protein [Chitinispirillaceae bacterium]